MLNSQLVSTLKALDQKGSISVFEGFNKTRPSFTLDNYPIAELIKIVAPEIPQIKADKANVRYFVCSALRDAPLVGKTLEIALNRGWAVIGKQRSASHVIEGCVIKLDFDGIPEPELMQLLVKLKSLCLAFALYTTHSHGSKENIRARLIAFFDRNLPPLEYKTAVLALSKELLGKSLDESEALLSQQASVYCAHPDRKHLARRIVDLNGYCISADFLLSIAMPTTQKVYTQSIIGLGLFNDVDRQKVLSALDWIDADGYESWNKTCMCLKALEPQLGDNAFKLWLSFSEHATEEKKRLNDLSQYDPMVMFDNMKPTMTADAALGTLMSMAKKTTLQIAQREDLVSGELTESGFRAIKHLNRYHPRDIQLLIEQSNNKELS